MDFVVVCERATQSSESDDVAWLKVSGKHGW